MSTWTSRPRRIVAALLAAAILAGCDPVALEPNGPAARAVALSSARIVVAGPPGYCVDTRASGETRRDDFAALRPCADLGAGGLPPQRALLLASVTARPSPAPVVAGREAALVAYFRSPQGLRALSRSRQAASVTVLKATHQGGAVLLYVRDTSPATDQGLNDRYWRALFDLKGRIVTLTVAGYDDSPLSEAAARSLLTSFIARLRALNQG